ncbi:MAG: CooT family nickel-binding protein [Desulfuromonadales bacterium]|nr:CooT family nickel-binding protein [Desulfuromonadales bacterium]
MCLDDGPFLLIQNEQETPLEDVASVLALPGKVRLIDVFGKHKDVDGSIQEIDILNRRITLG